MKSKGIVFLSFIMLWPLLAEGRIKLAALPQRGDTIIRLDNPNATLIEEQRVLTLQPGVNKVDFAWKGVSIDPDSIRLAVLDHPDKVVLLSVSYPPGEPALVWDISAQEAVRETVRISYLLSGIDRLVTYKAVANRQETQLDLRSFLVLRNFSGEDFASSRVLLDYGQAFEKGIAHEETKQMMFFHAGTVPVTKMWTFDAARQPWDPEKLDTNVGIPVSYRIKNDPASGLGKFALADGKARIYQDDGHGSTLFTGEDNTALVPVGEKTELNIGDSRDIVVTQRVMKQDTTNVRRNRKNQVVLYDMDETLAVKIENFKDTPATLTLIEHIAGQWEMIQCELKYQRKDAATLEFEIPLPAQGKKEFTLHYVRKNLRDGYPKVTMGVEMSEPKMREIEPADPAVAPGMPGGVK